jgi:hypothetical protein
MSCRCGPLLVAIACAAVRISGDHGTADLLALAYLGVLTLILHRGGDLQAAARVASSCNRLHPSRGSSGAYSVAH